MVARNRSREETQFGPYELIRKLASGGMGEIFLARHVGLAGFERHLVVKRLFRDLAERADIVALFQDEAKLLSCLAHPAVPQVFDLGLSEGYWYVAMEYVDGVSLADALIHASKAGAALPLPISLGIVHQLAEGLHHVHERKDEQGHPMRIVHRDVTPQNIMLTQDCITKLVDFGIAQSVYRSDATRSGLQGTLAYMSPEGIRALTLDRRADVFSLGIILYELTTGTRLYRGSDVQIMTAIVEQNVRSPRERFAEYPRELEEIVLSCLERDRKSRLPSAAHLSQAIFSFCLQAGWDIGPRQVARFAAHVSQPNENERPDSSSAQRPVPGIPPRADTAASFSRTATGGFAWMNTEEMSQIVSESIADVALPNVLLDPQGSEDE